MNKDSVSHMIAKRVAKELQSGEIVNLGIGIPTLVADYVPKEKKVFFQTENGLLGVGGSPVPGKEDPNLVNAGKMPATEEIGASYFSSADSFGMIRGGHVDVAILGALQVDQKGRLANWAIPGKTILGVGGAMDLLVGAKMIIVATTHQTKGGKPKIVKESSYPLTGIRPVDLIVTDCAVFSVREETLFLQELAPGITLEQLYAITEAFFLPEKVIQRGKGG